MNKQEIVERERENISQAEHLSWREKNSMLLLKTSTNVIECDGEKKAFSYYIGSQ